MGLGNRELATVILLAAGVVTLAAFATRSKTLRESLRAVAESFVQRKILIPILALAGSVVALVLAAHQVGLWDGRLTFSVIAWTATTGIGLLLKVAGRERAEPFFRPTLCWALRLTVFVEVVLTFVVFSLWVELVLAIVMSFLLMLLAVVETKAECTPTKRFLETIITVLSIMTVTLALSSLISGWDNFDKGHALRELALPLWLTIGMMPYVYAIALWASYDSSFTRIDVSSDDRAARRRVKLGLVLALHLRAAKANAFGGHWNQDLTETRTIGAAYRVGRGFLADLRQRHEAEQEAARRLEHFAGVEGTDEDGRQLDGREFEETKSELLSFAIAQMGWYKRDNRYREDVIELFSFPKLPDEHGIVVRISDDGQRWFAYRQTVTGWYFAVGAAEKPPDQWLYDGPVPPSTFPGEDPEWGERFGVDKPNW